MGNMKNVVSGLYLQVIIPHYHSRATANSAERKKSGEKEDWPIKSYFREGYGEKATFLEVTSQRIVEIFSGNQFVS